MSEAQLTACPVCGYDLRGLPRDWRCPECGLAYDAETRIWRAATSLKVYTIPIFLGVCAFIEWLMMISDLASGVIPRARNIVMFALPALAAAGMALRARRAERFGRCVVVLPAGVFVRTHDTQRLVPWHEIRAIEPADPLIKEEKNDCPVRIQTTAPLGAIMINRIFNSQERRAAFLAVAESRRQVCSADSHDPGAAAQG